MRRGARMTDEPNDYSDNSCELPMERLITEMELRYIQRAIETVEHLESLVVDLPEGSLARSFAEAMRRDDMHQDNIKEGL
jgi:hypothetical protein